MDVSASPGQCLSVATHVTVFQVHPNGYVLAHDFAKHIVSTWFNSHCIFMIDHLRRDGAFHPSATTWEARVEFAGLAFSPNHELICTISLPSLPASCRPCLMEYKTLSYTQVCVHQRQTVSGSVTNARPTTSVRSDPEDCKESAGP